MVMIVRHWTVLFFVLSSVIVVADTADALHSSHVNRYISDRQ